MTTTPTIKPPHEALAELDEPAAVEDRKRRAGERAKQLLAAGWQFAYRSSTGPDGKPSGQVVGRPVAPNAEVAALIHAAGHDAVNGACHPLAEVKEVGAGRMAGHLSRTAPRPLPEGGR